MTNIFDLCSLRAKHNWKGNLWSIEGTDISFQYEIEKYQDQTMLIFCIYIMKGNSTTIFNFSYDLNDDSLGVSIYENDDVLSHSSEIRNLDEFEARLFQIGTTIDTYDLSTDMYQTMRELHRIYFNEKYETVKTNMV